MPQLWLSTQNPGAMGIHGAAGVQLGHAWYPEYWGGRLGEGCSWGWEGCSWGGMMLGCKRRAVFMALLTA